MELVIIIIIIIIITFIYKYKSSVTHILYCYQWFLYLLWNTCISIVCLSKMSYHMEFKTIYRKAQTCHSFRGIEAQRYSFSLQFTMCFKKEGVEFVRCIQNLKKKIISFITDKEINKIFFSKTYLNVNRRKRR
jgi:hypothetical protein